MLVYTFPALITKKKGEKRKRAPIGVFIASKKVVKRLTPCDVIEVSRCRLSRSWRCHSSAGECGRRLFCCRSFSGVTVHGSFGSQELGTYDDSDTRVCSGFLPQLLRPTARIATSDSMTLRLL
ncbi:hypothetical protein ISCGN_017179 [Ixodes scapularis]